MHLLLCNERRKGSTSNYVMIMSWNAWTYAAYAFNNLCESFKEPRNENKQKRKAYFRWTQLLKRTTERKPKEKGIFLWAFAAISM